MMQRFVLTLLVALATVANGGTLPERVIGGTEAEEGAFPYQVSLRSNNRHFCAGSIVNERWILTAANCVASKQLDPSSIEVVAGTNSLDEGGDYYVGSEVVIHPDFTLPWVRTDIALVKVNEDMKFGDKVAPVVLPEEDFTEADFTATLSGWGSDGYYSDTVTNKLQQINLSIISQQVCRARSARVIDSIICTLTYRGAGACRGDSGGPLVADGVQVGVVSWGNACARGTPNIYIRVWNFVEWINEVIGV